MSDADWKARRILITRARDDANDWVRKLASMGLHATSLPCIKTELLDTPELRARLTKTVERADWLVFTSRRGVEAFTALSDAMIKAPVAAVGPATAAACRVHLGRVDLVADESIGEAKGGTAAALAEALITRLGDADGKSILLALAVNAGTVLERRLAETGAEPARMELYRTIPAPPGEPKRALSSLEADNIFLASPSAVTGFVNQVAIDVAARYFTIGPSTSAKARAAGLPVTRESRVPSLEGMVEAMQWTS